MLASQRSLQGIRSNNTKPEEIVRKFLFSKGFRYRKNDKCLPGKPDIVLPKYKTVIFIHGCFWHCHVGCPDYVVPKSNQEYWIPKLERNRIRDEANMKTLQADGWRVIIIWECDMKKAVQKDNLEKLLRDFF